jgi:hypothetical protein
MLPGVQRMWGHEASHSQVNSHVGSWSPKRIPQFLERNYRGQNSSPWRVPYIIGNLLKCKCIKWSCITHLDICNTSYGQKKDWESNWQFDSRPLKVKNRPDFVVCKQHATYHWKVLDEGYNFALDLIVIEGLHKKLCALKVAGVLVVGILGLSLGSPKTKSHLDVAPAERHIVYYKGEGGSFPQVQAIVSLVSPNCMWLVLAPKAFQLCTNHLVLVLCTSVWVVEACQFFLIPSRSSNTPFYPFKVLRAKKRAPTPCSSAIFCLGLTFGIPQRVKSASEMNLTMQSWYTWTCNTWKNTFLRTTKTIYMMSNNKYNNVQPQNLLGKGTWQNTFSKI